MRMLEGFCLGLAYTTHCCVFWLPSFPLCVQVGLGAEIWNGDGVLMLMLLFSSLVFLVGSCFVLGYMGQWDGRSMEGLR
ncbi:hypothetical protein HDV57DRAFT_456612 [Trichoderma longibrachiatum]